MDVYGNLAPPIKNLDYTDGCNTSTETNDCAISELYGDYDGFEKHSAKDMLNWIWDYVYDEYKEAKEKSRERFSYTELTALRYPIAYNGHLLLRPPRMHHVKSSNARSFAKPYEVACCSCLVGKTPEKTSGQSYNLKETYVRHVEALACMPICDFFEFWMGTLGSKKFLSQDVLKAFCEICSRPDESCRVSCHPVAEKITGFEPITQTNLTGLCKDKTCMERCSWHN